MKLSRRTFLFGITALAPLNAAKQDKHRRQERAYLRSFLASHKLPPAQIGSVVAHGDWLYEMSEDRFVMARRLGTRADAPSGAARGELVWLQDAGRGWQAGAPKVFVRPTDREIYFQSHSLPEHWAGKVLGANADRRAVHCFTVRECELTPPDSPEAGGPVTWELPAWFENAGRIAEQFRAGKL